VTTILAPQVFFQFKVVVKAQVKNGDKKSLK
jgi:hypothetical protein